MGDQATLDRLKLRRDKILEIQWPEIQEPPEDLMKIRGFREYHTQQKLYQERLQGVIQNVINNLGIATSTP